MRRTTRDIKELYKCYCRCWQHDNLERVKRIEKHGWVENIWVRDYDSKVRMSVTERGSEIVSAYYSLKSGGNESLDEIGSRKFLNELQ